MHFGLLPTPKEKVKSAFLHTVLQSSNYLKNALGCGLLYSNHGPTLIHGFTNAVWMGIHWTRCLQRVIVSLLVEIWCLGRERNRLVTHTTAESKNKAMAQTTCEMK